MDCDASSLYAQFFWGTIGFGFLMYGSKQRAVLSLITGLLLSVFSYVVSSVLWLSFASIAVLVAFYYGNRHVA